MALAFQPAAPKTLNPKHAHILEAPRDSKKKILREFDRAFRRSPSGIAKRRRELILKRNPVQLLGFGVRHALPNRLDLGFFLYSLRVTVFVSSDGGAAISRFGLKATTETWLWVYILFNYFPACRFHSFFIFSPSSGLFSYSFSLFLIPCSSFFQQRFKEQHFSSVDEVKAAVRNCFRKQDGKSYR